ncbi:hypothetical protein QYF61_027326 [Mycteria americana]|uniref:Integrase catalytic domain-containing protein n=1 Tax=Mycteria americana TaxID=33587 RepID=A0AAN7RHG4_MYCAM|nr:hypothetical protein QYF61_027326 [Mycteria americana]
MPNLGDSVNLQMDFIHMPKYCNLEYVLVITDMFSGWVEAYPCKHADATIVAKKLLRDLIPRCGIPLTIDSDRGTHFTSHLIQNICKALNIKQHLHCTYHPQSSGAVERRNSDLKSKLAKICEETGLKWPDALPLALMHMRSTANTKHGLSPHEIFVEWPMRLPHSPLEAPHKLDLQLADDSIALLRVLDSSSVGMGQAQTQH